MPQNEFYEAPSAWAELPPVASEEITLPLPRITGELDTVEPQVLSQEPPFSTKISPEALEVLADEAESLAKRAATTQATALHTSGVTTLIWMGMNVYDFLEEGAESSTSNGFHAATSIGMIICGVVMTCAAVASQVYRRRVWGVRQRAEELIAGSEQK